MRTFLALILLGIPVASRGGLATDAGQTLKISPGIRAAGLGEAFVAVADDASALDWNPAGLAQLRRPEFQAVAMSYLADTRYGYGAGVLPLGSSRRSLVLGLSARVLVVPPFNSTGDPGDFTGGASDLAATLGAARSLTRGLSLGLQGRFVSSRLEDHTARTGAFGMGLLAEPIRGLLKAGLSWENIASGKLRYSAGGPREGIPSILRAGLALQRTLAERTSGILSFEVNQANGGALALKAGCEMRLGPALSLRVGRGLWSGDPTKAGGIRSDLGVWARTGFGLSLASKGLGFDYAFVPMGDLGPVHRVGFKVGGGGRSGGNPEIAKGEPQAPLALEWAPAAARRSQGRFAFRLPPGGEVAEKGEGITGWVLEINDPRGRVLRSFRGKGAPPPEISWPQEEDQGTQIVMSPYAGYTLRWNDDDGNRGSQAGTLALSPAFDPGPGTEPEAPGEPESLPVLLFKTGSADIGLEAGPALRQISEACLRMPGIRVSVHGHADREGSAEFNMKLSLERAKSVGILLARLADIPASRIQTRGFGKSSPRASNETPEGRMENRRVEVFLYNAAETPGFVEALGPSENHSAVQGP